MKKYTLAILIALAIGTQPSLAQPQLSKEQLKPFEGYYRSSKVKDLVVQITIKNDTLMALPLWADRVFHLLPKQELVFQTAESVERGPMDLVFFRDPAGAIAAVDIGNSGVKWNLEKDYKPIVKKVMAHNPEQLRPYVGVYRLKGEGERFLQFYVKDNDLILKQVWDGTELPFHPENPEDFFTDKIAMFTLKFTKDQQGNVSQVLAFGRDVWLKAEQPDVSEASLDAAGGKFQSKDDPDNQVTIAVKDKHLVVKQLWDNKEITLQALTSDYFYNDALSYKLQLHKDGNGKINEVVLLETSVFVRMPQ